MYWNSFFDSGRLLPLLYFSVVLLCMGAISILGMSLTLVTFNVAQRDPPDACRIGGFIDALFEGPGFSKWFESDIVSVGFQEVSVTTRNDRWNVLIRESLKDRGYVQICCQTVKYISSYTTKPRMWGISLVIFVKRRLLPCISSVETKFARCSFGGYLGIKGALVLRITMNDGTKISLANAHFLPDNERLTERIQQYYTVLERLKFKDAGSQSIISDDYVFWMGDFNFRVDFYSKEEAISMLESADDDSGIKKLLAYDQMNRCRNRKEAMHHFEEGVINFKPTYRFLFNSSSYDDQRTPSWCDRIVWRVEEVPGLAKSRPVGILKCQLMSYDSVNDIMCSDHKPVVANFRLSVSPDMLKPQWTVTFVQTLWLVDQANRCEYRFNRPYSPSVFDWVALYPMNLESDLDDVVTWMSVLSAWEEPVGSKTQNLLFKRLYMPKAGVYRLGYYSSARNSLIGLSEPIEIAVTAVDSASEAD